MLLPSHKLQEPSYRSVAQPPLPCLLCPPGPVPRSMLASSHPLLGDCSRVFIGGLWVGEPFKDVDFMVDAAEGLCHGYWSNITTHPTLTEACLLNSSGARVVEVVGPPFQVQTHGSKFTALGAARVPMMVRGGRHLVLTCVIIPGEKKNFCSFSTSSLYEVGLSVEYVNARRASAPPRPDPFALLKGKSDHPFGWHQWLGS